MKNTFSRGDTYRRHQQIVVKSAEKRRNRGGNRTVVGQEGVGQIYFPWGCQKIAIAMAIFKRSIYNRPGPILDFLLVTDWIFTKSPWTDTVIIPILYMRFSKTLEVPVEILGRGRGPIWSPLDILSFRIWPAVLNCKSRAPSFIW